jgi:16S rRNA (uracil1498-N3)-methyltransferase
MPRPNQSVQRLYVSAALNADAELVLEGNPAHYLRNVVRLGIDDDVLLFNGRDGEWLAQISQISKKQVSVQLRAITRPQTAPTDLQLLLAPIKRDRLDYVAQKATEMGATRITPVITRRTQNTKLNLDRLRANAIEAAEQCNLLSVPHFDDAIRLDALLEGWADDRVIVLCDEHADVAAGMDALQDLKGRKRALLIGPEGGFDPQERDQLLARQDTLALSLGPRILRADTALVAALALVQSQIGDWRDG